MKSNYLVTWFYAESKESESFYPSVGGETSSTSFQSVYWKCIYVFFRTALLTQKHDLKYIFYTNTKCPQNIDGIDFEHFFEEAGIEVVYQELTGKTPADWYGAWRNQFYVFDILRDLKRYYGNFLILDSDILIRGDLNGLFDDIQKKQGLTYNCGYKTDALINGITTKDMRNLYQSFYGKRMEFQYKGGEFIALSSEMIPRVLNEYDRIWPLNYERYMNRELKLNEEAHFLSLIYARLGIQNDIGNLYIKRMWTAFKCDNIENKDKTLLLWHLPAEKKYAFKALFEYLNHDATEEEYLSYSQRILSIGQCTILRKLKRALLILKLKR